VIVSQELLTGGNLKKYLARNLSAVQTMADIQYRPSNMVILHWMLMDDRSQFPGGRPYSWCSNKKQHNEKNGLRGETALEYRA
jgi:hypothetical protein